ncbi:MAG: dihydroneopterin aldolase [Spirochaetales bacterium]|nr:dihydroneopterin aldolase [Spirochaetales bacterium]
MASEPDKIYIRDLLLRCIIGINDDERVNRQDVVINICMEADLSEAGRSDDIADTVNYKQIKTEVIRLVEHSSFFLVEKLATEIAAICLKHDRVQKTRVLVEKPAALRFARTVGVEIVRSRE